MIPSAKPPYAYRQDDPSARPGDEAPVFKSPPRIELTCPDCGHVQSEPVRVVSTQCRNCLAHYQIRDGQVVERPRPRIRLAKPGANEEPFEPQPPPPTPASSPRRKPAPVRMPWWKRLILRPGPPREIRCFACKNPFTAGSDVESTQCPGCGAYVSLRNYDIRESWTRPLQTRGDVVLHKEGVVSQARIECHNFKLFGKILGDLECSGELAIHASGKIPSHVSCHRLHVPRKVRVDFLEPVVAHDVLIEGEVRGVLQCTGTVTLARRALLQGLVRAAAIEIRPGASHVGIFDPLPSAGESLAQSRNGD
jgi:cytoskeletal protein CcmA (bactofilin family)/predicted RNA-binding Zn-ribbon protein involved in translation (DUF1610 family)